MKMITSGTPALVLLAAAAASLLVTPTNAKTEFLTSTPIAGARTDCSEPMHSVQLADNVAMSYVIATPDDDGITPATISVSMEFDTLAWVSFGYSSDDKGKMIGSEAIIGLPDQPSGPLKYTMSSEKVEGVVPRAASEQTLRNGQVWQSDGKTYLRFTKQLIEPGEIPINAQGTNYFMWAYGYENALGLHDKKTGTGAFALDVTSCVPPVVPPSLPPTDPPVAAPTSPKPTAMPTKSPTESEFFVGEEEQEEVEAKEEDVQVADEDGFFGPGPNFSTAPLDCTQYQQSVQLDPKLKMSYVVNPDGNGLHDGTISVKLEYEGTAWVALGVAPNAEGKMMGSESVVAIPSESISQTNPGEYYMMREENEGVFLMEDDKQTLADGSIVQVDGETIVEFTKLLAEEGKHGLSAGNGQESTLLWAYGYSNDLNLHKATGAFRLTLQYCGEEQLTSESLKSLSKYTAEQRRRMWTAHAFLGLIAWAVLAPSAVAASWLRKLFQKWGAFWFKTHMYMNILAFFLTIAAFAISVTMYSDENEPHFVGLHEAMGLALMLLVTLQACNGIFRPPAAPKSNISKTVRDNVQTASDDDEEEMGTEVSYIPPPPPPPETSLKNEQPENTLKKRRIRAAWEVIHKLLGVFLLFIGLWQVQTGIVLYADRFGTTDYTNVFWWCIGAFAALVLALTVYIRVKDVY